MSSQIELDVRKFGKTSDIDAEGNIYGKDLLPAGGLLNAATAGRVIELSSGSPIDTEWSTAATIANISGTTYSVREGGFTSAFPDPGAGQDGFVTFKVTKKLAGDWTLQLSGSAVYVGLGQQAATNLTLTDGRVGDQVSLRVTPTDIYILPGAKGLWALSA